MTVIVSDGQNKLRDTIQNILDTFLTDSDYSRDVFIKPNIVFAVKPRSGEITHPALVKALIMALKERFTNINITIGEGVAAGCTPSENFRVSGYAKLATELNVPLVDLHSAERTTVAWKFGRIELPCVALESTYINLPLLKPSSACTISGALKNQKGLLLPEMKKHFHRLGLHEQIAELNAIIRPTLTIMDCGRFFGRNILISGDNCGEIDATGCHLLGIDEPEHLQLSRRAGVFSPGYCVQGEKILKHAYSHRMVKQFKHLGRLRLWANPRACTMCRYLFHDLQQNWLKDPYLIARIKMLAYSIKGAEIIMGSNPQWQKEYPTVICFGNCTRRIAKEGGYIHIPGCPPSLDDLDNNLP